MNGRHTPALTREQRRAVRPLRKAALACVCALIVAAWPSAPVRAQAQHFRHYTGLDGLPQAQVLAVHQDSLGFLWAGTFGGLGRFDGRTFAQFSTADGLSSNAVQTLASEADGTLWAGQSRGLCALRPQQARFECPAIAGIADRNIQALLWGPDGLWVGTREGLYRLWRGKDGRYEASMRMAGGVTAIARAGGSKLWVGGPQGLQRIDTAGTGPAEAIPLPRGDTEVQALLVDGARLWIGTKSGLLVRDGQQVSTAPGLAPDLLQLGITGLALGPHGRLWATTRRGLLRQQGDGFTLLTRADGLSEENLDGVIRDREGNLWIAGDGGLSSYAATAFIGYGERDGLMQNFVRAINEDASGRLWLGTRQGVQVIRLDAAGRMQEQFRLSQRDGLVDDRIYNIEFPAPGEALISTGHGLAHWREGEGVVRLYTTADGLPDNGVRAVRLRPDGSLIIATSGGVAVMRDGVIAPSRDPELAQAQALSISEDRGGRLWFGSLQKGVLVLAPDGSVEHLTAAAGLTDQVVWDTAVDAQGGVWIGSNGDGLFHVDAKGAIRRYTTREGLVDNFIWQVLVDRNGDVWSYTNRGLSRFNGRDFSNFGIDDGLLNQEGAATASVETADGERWFASGDGLMRYIETDRKVAVVAPKVIIHAALAAGAPMVPGGRLAPGKRSFEFGFAAPLFRRNSDLLYRYRLRGAGDEWTDLRAYHPISYANLGAGKYVFEAQARRTGQPWPDDVAAFAFEIEPPLWQQAWFRILALLSILAAVWLAARLRLRQVELGRRALERLVRERTEALEHANDQLKHASFTDPLTELRNRRYLASQVALDVAQVCRSYAEPVRPPNCDMIFMMIDIDHFKQINDTYGHTVGDRVLREYAHVINTVIRDSDYAVRWGGEEFVLVARQAEATQCAALAERLVERVRSTEFPIDDAGTTIRSTCSVGVSHFPFVEGAPSALEWPQIIDICDAAVYLAKAGGRDGWVAIHGPADRPIEDPAKFIQRLKADPVALARAGVIRLSGTHCPTAGAAQPMRPLHEV
ncbi:diguanylate cyclase [Lysobacter korlensis]|uniref:diguanylate cyclase n=1 Tax=Lysobacter korlensis TaxID=553636 RepID=A0ABV6RSG3_9GAMM